MNPRTLKYVVKLVNVEVYYLHGTAWTSEPLRADKFPCEGLALAALGRARVFMKPAFARRARVTLENKP